jgi:hypothetical protein
VTVTFPGSVTSPSSQPGHKQEKLVNISYVTLVAMVELFYPLIANRCPAHGIIGSLPGAFTPSQNAPVSSYRASAGLQTKAARKP